MSDTQPSQPEITESQRYAIRVMGHIDQRWAEWLSDLTFTHASDGTTMLDGPLSDQAALHGVLNKIRDLGLPIISVQLSAPRDN